MFKPVGAFSGFSVSNINEAQKFYQESLGLEVENTGMGLRLHLPGGSTTFVYPKEDHAPASYTALNFVVKNIDDAVDELTKNGVVFDHYSEWQDDKQIARGLSNDRGPDIAWFKDPAGNILAVLQDK